MAGWLPLARGLVPDAVMNFSGGVYTVGATSYTLAQTIDRTGQVTPATGLIIPDNDTAVAIVQILGPFNARLIAGAWSIVFSVTGFSTTHNGNSVFFNVQDNALTAAAQLFTKEGVGTYDVDFDDFDAITDNLVRSFGADYSAGSHKIGITRNNFAQPIAFAIDGAYINAI